MQDKQITFPEAMDIFLQYARIRNLAPTTIVHYRKRINGMVNFLETKYPGITPAGVDIRHLRDRVNSMMDAEADITSINHFVAVAKTFFAFLAEEGYLPQNPSARLKKLKDPKVLIKTFSPDDIKALLAQPNMLRFSGIRDYLLMVLLLDTGLRISETMNIRLQDIDRVHSSITVMGKGSKERVVHFGQVVRRALNQYLERRVNLETEYLFVTEYGDPMQARIAQEQITRYGALAKIEGIRVSPHTFRHTFAKTWIINGGDVFSLQKMLGHTTMDMVRRYVNLANEDVGKAHRVYSPADNLLGRGQMAKEKKDKQEQQDKKRLK